MTTRITCDVMNTKELLKEVLVSVNANQQCMFICEPGLGVRRMQALRVALSRVRNNLKNRNKPRRYFQLNHSIFPWTENGKRLEAVTVWKTVSERHRMIESLEDLVGSGATL